MTVQKHIRLDDDVAKSIEDWRRTQTPIPNFNQAINTLLQRYFKLLSFKDLKHYCRNKGYLNEANDEF